MLRDVLTGEIPLILRPGRLYATAAIVGAVVFVVLGKTALGPKVAALAGMAVTAGLRLVAIAYGVKLPTVLVPPEGRR
jgi:uncharacterized membrane protein YeiH